MENPKWNLNKYSNFKGDKGIKIAKEFLKKYFKDKKINIFETNSKSCELWSNFSGTGKLDSSTNSKSRLFKSKIYWKKN